MNSGKEKKDRNFAVFILSHGRADNAVTYKALQRQGYTGKVYFIVDNLDDQIEEYQNNFGKENVLIFDKLSAAKKVDTMDTSGELRAILFARNQCFSIAEQMGITHFLELDDDYSSFQFRYIEDERLLCKFPFDLDNLFEYFCDCLDETNALTIAMAQGGDFIGGVNGGGFRKRILRKAMNSFFCRTDKPIEFRGTMNEDVTTYTSLGSQGSLLFTVEEVSISQLQTQSLSGGMSDAYSESGTYIKSFYSVMAMPSAVKISMMGGGGNGNTYYRIHNNINWNSCVPKIIEEKYKKR